VRVITDAEMSHGPVEDTVSASLTLDHLPTERTDALRPYGHGEHRSGVRGLLHGNTNWLTAASPLHHGYCRRKSQTGPLPCPKAPKSPTLTRRSQLPIWTRVTRLVTIAVQDTRPRNYDCSGRPADHSKWRSRRPPEDLPCTT
jgi:hypothetical protein